MDNSVICFILGFVVLNLICKTSVYLINQKKFVFLNIVQINWNISARSTIFNPKSSQKIGK